MPPLPTVTNTLKITLGWTIDMNPAGSRFFYTYTGGPPAVADLNTLCGNIATAYNTDFSPLQNSSYVLTSVQAEDLNTSSGNLGVVACSYAGGLIGNALTENVAACINFKIDRRYRGGHPRIMLPIGTNAETASNRAWSNGFISSVNAAWSSFNTTIGALTFSSFSMANHVSVAYYKGVYTTSPPWRGPGYKYPPKPVAGPVTPDTVVNHALRPTIGSQRRRLTSSTP